MAWWISFPYPLYESIQPAEVPDENLVGIFTPRTLAAIDEEAVLSSGLENPFGAPRLRDAVRPRDRVLILIDDGTRDTPIHRLLPYIFNELIAAGIHPQNVAFLTAQGTHRRMTEPEIRRKIGDQYFR